MHFGHILPVNLGQRSNPGQIYMMSRSCGFRCCDWLFDLFTLTWITGVTKFEIGFLIFSLLSARVLSPGPRPGPPGPDGPRFGPPGPPRYPWLGPGLGRPRNTVRTPGPTGRRSGGGRFDGTIIPTSFWGGRCFWTWNGLSLSIILFSIYYQKWLLI